MEGRRRASPATRRKGGGEDDSDGEADWGKVGYGKRRDAVDAFLDDLEKPEEERGQGKKLGRIDNDIGSDYDSSDDPDLQVSRPCP